MQAVVLIALGVFTKTAALLATIPQPIIGGIFAMSVCLVSGVCLSNLQVGDITSSEDKVTHFRMLISAIHVISPSSAAQLLLAF